VARLSYRTAEVSPLLYCPMVEGVWLGAPVLNVGGDELVHEHAPPMGHLQQGKHYPNQ